MKRIKCTIDYPWAGIVPDEQIIEVEDNATKKEIEEAAYEALEDMI